LTGWVMPAATQGTTIDAALIRVDPSLIDPQLGGGLGHYANDPNNFPQVGQRLRTFANGNVRHGLIQEISAARVIDVDIFGNARQINYQDQILCESFTEPGCSGAIVINDDNEVVGMVVAGQHDPAKGETFTLVTPIGSLLSGVHWDSNVDLRLCSVVPGGLAPFPPPPVVPTGKTNFVATFTPFAKVASSMLGLGGGNGVDWRIIIAQSALETGWGLHAPNNNYFGIKAAGGPQLDTLEEDPPGTVRKTKASFATYPDPRASFIGYANFLLANQRYSNPAFGDFLGTARRGGSLSEQTAALQQSGYATDSRYGAKVLDIAQGIP